VVQRLFTKVFGTYLHRALLTVTDEQLQPLQSDQQRKLFGTLPQLVATTTACGKRGGEASSRCACMTAAVPCAAGQLVTSERGACGGPLALHYEF
jgi:hypothetical protein